MFKSKKVLYSSENQKKAWFFLLPSLLVILIFSIYPLLRSFYISFHSGLLINQTFTGFSNYVKLFQDPIFLKAIVNTVINGIFVVPIGLILSLLIAWTIFEKVKHKAIFETIFFMPYVTSMIAVGIVFRFFFNRDFGLINFFLGLFGIAPINWLDNVQMSIPTLVIFGIWYSLAFNIIILLSGFRNINKEYYVLADLYGASNWEKFRKITFPQLLPTISFLLTVNFIGAFKIYTEVFALFNGQAGIANSAITAVFYIYNKFYINANPGLAMAASVVLFLIIILITILQRFIIRRKD